MTNQPQLLRSLWNVKSNTDFRPELIVDVGACTGTSGLYGLFTDPAPLYLLIEPLEAFNESLTYHLRNHRHRIINCCLSSSSGVAHFKVCESMDSSHLVQSRGEQAKGTKTIQVPVDTLDNIIATHIPETSTRRLDLVVKIDVQGAEGEVLTGGANTLATHNALVIVEVSTSREKAIQIFSRMDSLDYELIDCVDFVRFPGATKMTSQFDAIFARKAISCAL